MKEPVIIFDFDGTLADTFENFIAIGNTLAKEFKFKTIERHQIETFKNKTIRQAIRDLEVPIFHIPKLLFKGKKAQYDQIQNITLIKNMALILTQLKNQNVQLGLVSTNTLKNIHAVLKNQHLENMFGVGSGLFGKRRALNKVIKQHHLNRDDILYVGDEVRDIEASHHVGIAIAAVTWGYNSRNALQTYAPDYLIDHPQELLHIVQEMNAKK